LFNFESSLLEYNRTVKRLPEIGEPSGISAKDVVTNGNADATDFLSDSDSQKSIPAANFEACSSLVDGKIFFLCICQLIKVLDPPDCEVTHKIEKSSNESTGDANGPGEIKEEEEEKHEELKDASKNTSFDFDDSHGMFCFVSTELLKRRFFRRFRRSTRKRRRYFARLMSAAVMT
jgi:hypothetical protein